MNRLDDPASAPTHSTHLISTNGREVERIWYPDTPLFEGTCETLISACQSTKHEVCGLISTEQEIHFIENSHEEPSHNFLPDHNEYIIAINTIFEAEEEVLGIFHSHPNNVVWPTPRDIRGWPVETDWRYWIVTNAEVIEWALLCPDLERQKL